MSANETKKVTDGVEIRVYPLFVPEESKPEDNYYFFAYHITITNHRKEMVQLLNRHWIISDAYGRVREVQGEGVVGQQPELSPGESFEYTSYCPLATPSGQMKGSYEFLNENSERFFVEIPEFDLADEQYKPTVH